MSVDGPSISAEQQADAAPVDGLPPAAATVLAVCLGAAIPAAVLGKAVLGVVLLPAGLVALFALSRRDIRKAVLRTALGPTGMAFGLFGAVSLVSVLLSDHLAKSLETWSRTAAFIVFGLTATHVLAQNRHALDLARRALVLVGLLALSYVVIAVNVTEDVLALIALGSEIRKPVALNFKGFASAVVCLLPVALWGAAGPGAGRKALRVLILFLAALAIWLDGKDISLAAILGIAAAVILLGAVRYFGRLARRIRIFASVTLIAASLMLAVAVTAALPGVDEEYSDQQLIPTWLLDGHRQFIWAFTVSATHDRPVFGHGPNTINLVAGADRRVPAYHATFVPSHPHNWIYEIASETGLVGLFALCLALVLLLRRVSILALNGFRAGWAAVALFGAFWGSSLVNFSIWAAWWQLTFVALLSVLMAAATSQRDLKQHVTANGG